MLKVLVLQVVSVVFHGFWNCDQVFGKFGNDTIWSHHSIREKYFLGYEKLTNNLYERTKVLWLLLLLTLYNITNWKYSLSLDFVGDLDQPLIIRQCF